MTDYSIFTRNDLISEIEALKKSEEKRIKKILKEKTKELRAKFSKRAKNLAKKEALITKKEREILNETKKAWCLVKTINKPNRSKAKYLLEIDCTKKEIEINYNKIAKALKQERN